MSPDDILKLAFGIPLSACLGLGLGLFVCAAVFGVDLTALFRKDK
jgi:hypothetical protein